MKQQLLTTNIDIKGRLKLLNEQSLLNFAVKVSFSGRKNVKMIPFYVVTSGFHMTSNGWWMVAFSESLEMFCFPVMESSFCFANVEFINNQPCRWPWTSEIGSSDICMENRIWCGVCFEIWSWDWRKSRKCIRRISDVLWLGYCGDLSRVTRFRYLFWEL